MFPGQRREVEVNCGKHVLNQFGARGLTFLTRDADEEQVKKEAIQRFIDFKRKQVLDHNTRNEQKRQMGLAWTPPSPTIRRYAEELGVDILEPTPLKQKGDVDSGIITYLMEENKSLKSQMKELMDLVRDKFKDTEEEPPKKKPFGRQRGDE